MAPPPSTTRLLATLARRLTASPPTQSSENQLTLHEIPVKAFNHLSVMAYIAFAFILLAVITVLVYMMYSCYHSARANQRHIELRSSRSLGGVNTGFRLSSISPKPRSGCDDTSTINEVHSVNQNFGEKVKSGSRSTIKALRLPFTKKKRFSSELGLKAFCGRNSSPLNSLFDSKDTILDFDINGNYLSSPPLAHCTSDRTAAYLPFVLPPPPPSPTKAYKEYLARQRQMYRGSMPHSPVSPSPSTCPPERSPPPITAKWLNATNTFSFSEHDMGRTPLPQPGMYQRRNPCQPGDNSGASFAAVEFDTNNIRFASSLDPFMDPLWNEPKLSPIGGSLITSGNDYLGAGLATPGYQFFRDAGPSDCQLPNIGFFVDTPPVSPKKYPKTPRLISPDDRPEGFF
ncbi:hypothetical protein D9619_001257 [Psilocybe cf. subviscida]|uniref:Uncharacterized protein n=1 Tax=Psilocybe cf. subviscida TaxID=2480587 RepID=A0A8H5BEE3_9AGAR|nr:hypothetical protein D9619_001257 [Psilocybe cf. subviscida]